MKHNYGKYESVKFNYRRDDYKEYLNYLQSKDLLLADVFEHMSSFIGHMSLNRMLTLYEFYKMVKNVAGHYAEVGMYMGAGSLLFAKLMNIHEPESLSLVHGFDWFKGTKKSDSDSDLLLEKGYTFDFNFLMEIIRKQGLDNIIKVHNIDLVTETKTFFKNHPHLQFKLIFMDAGIYEVMRSSIPYFWDRLTPGGIMIFDQFSNELAQGETMAIRELLPKEKIKTLPGSWMPNAYIIKE